ncbi:FadR/GntR family transcriptional regulator [Oryzifoliimicrobium ureilyticus]|uniref:FadR/GntR family transcriptional regulator n=1 Tax=Oryzifoliimicrobium ureilyticus TaxID=3113724 RepID=UPI0030764CD2
MKPVSRSNLSDNAFEAIRAEIVARRWTIGERLPNEAELAAMLSVSRGTVREAVRALVAQGYLETRQGSGTYVLSAVDAGAALTAARRASLRDRFEARCALDVEGARLAALRARPGVIKRLRVLLDARGEYDGMDKKGFVERDFAFHKAVIEASENRAMAEIYDFFSNSIAETIEATIGQEVPEPDMAAHRAIVDAIETGDPQKAEAAVRQFMAPVFAALDRKTMS